MLDNVRFSRVPTGLMLEARQETNWGFHGSGEISNAKSLNQWEKMSFRMAINCCQDILSTQTVTLEKKWAKQKTSYKKSSSN